MFLRDLFFPKFCLGCGYLGVYVCPSCQKQLRPINQDVCLYCNKPSLFGLTHLNCTSKFNIDGLLTIYHYNPILKKIIKNIKYRLATEIWQEFCQAIEPGVIMKLGFYNKLSSTFFIQPIPLTKNKYNERGFNQAQLICDYFSRFIHYPIVDLLIKKQETFSQAQIKNKKDRYLNMKGVFDINKKGRDVRPGVSNKNIILIDDVVTSGSTVKEAARILKKAGVKKIYVLALAKG